MKTADYELLELLHSKLRRDRRSEPDPLHNKEIWWPSLTNMCQVSIHKEDIDRVDAHDNEVDVDFNTRILIEWWTEIFLDYYTYTVGESLIRLPAFQRRHSDNIYWIHVWSGFFEIEKLVSCWSWRQGGRDSLAFNSHTIKSSIRK